MVWIEGVIERSLFSYCRGQDTYTEITKESTIKRIEVTTYVLFMYLTHLWPIPLELHQHIWATFRGLISWWVCGEAILCWCICWDGSHIISHRCLHYSPSSCSCQPVQVLLSRKEKRYRWGLLYHAYHMHKHSANLQERYPMVQSLGSRGSLHLHHTFS